MSSRANRTVLCTVILAGALVFALAAPAASQEPEGGGQATPASVVGSAIVTTGESWCQEGQTAVKKSLVFITKATSGELDEVRGHSWAEATGESCEMSRGEAAGLPDIPEPSAAEVKALREDAEKRSQEETTRGYWCSNSCQYTRGQYQCWWRNYYWVEYCYNECHQYTGYYYYWWKGYC